jgi:hypothetical protein
MTFRYSITDPGRPWVMISGIAPGRADRTWMKWTATLSIATWNCGKPFSRASVARQS